MKGGLIINSAPMGISAPDVEAGFCCSHETGVIVGAGNQP